MIEERTGVKIGHEKLRKLSVMLADAMEPHRETCQCEQLLEWMDEAEKNEYLETLGLEEPGLKRLIREGYNLLDLT